VEIVGGWAGALRPAACRVQDNGVEDLAGMGVGSLCWF